MTKNKDLSWSVFSGLALGLLGATFSACSGASPAGNPALEATPPGSETPLSFSAPSQESATLGIDHWEAHSTEEGTELLAFSREGAPLAEALLLRAGPEASALDLHFSYPEEDSLRLLADGRLEVGGETPLAAFARAAFADLTEPESLPGSSAPASALGAAQQPLTTTSGSLHYNSNLFGHHEVRVVGRSTCPNGETRQFALASGRKKEKRCSFSRWHVLTDPEDCRIQIEVDIPSLKSDDCDYEVVSD